MKNTIVKKLVKTLIFCSLALTIPVTVFADEEPVISESEEEFAEDLAGAKSGSLDMAEAPTLELGTTYTYDFAGKYNADLSVNEEYKFFYFAYNVSKEGFYNVRFRIATSEETDIKLYDESGNRVAGDQHLVNKAVVENDIPLKPGTYYLGIYTRGENSFGSVYFGERSQKITDPEFNTSQTIYHNTQTGIVGTKDEGFAPRLELGEAYTYDYRAKNNANLRIDEEFKIYYFKYIVEDEGFYNVRFKNASATEADIRLYKADGERVEGKDHFVNAAYVKEDIPLTPGVYFIGIYVRGGDSYGSVYFGKRSQEIVDVEYDLNQQIFSNTQKGIKADKDMGFAPRLELGKDYTLDYRSKFDANLNIDEVYKWRYVKYIAKEKGTYSVIFKSTTQGESDIHLYDADGNKLVGKNNLGNETYEKKDISLNPGVYYVGIYIRSEDSRASIQFKNLSKKGSDDKKEDSKTDTPIEIEVVGDNQVKISDSIITVNSLDGEYDINNLFVNNKGKITINPPVKAGYTFKGWYNAGKKVSSINKKYLDSNKNFTLNAGWSENVYSIKFKMTKPVSTAKIVGKAKAIKTKYSSDVVLPSGITASVKANEKKGIVAKEYVLKGFTDEVNGTTVKYEAGSKVRMLAGKDKTDKAVTLYPVWE